VRALVIVAGGSGQRLGASVPKGLVEVAGRSLIEHCLDIASTCPQIDQKVVVAPSGHIEAVRAVVGDAAAVVAGGGSRDESVRKGLAVLDPQVRWVLIHDAARPFTPRAVFESVLSALAAGAEAVVPGLPMADTIKTVTDGHVGRTIPRQDLIAVQTPQGFALEPLRAAHRMQSGEVTDDAQLMEQAGVPIAVVPGSPLAFKITTGFDLRVAEAMAEEE
jgi:2-C-methyl-D-erythritol 4-phosphate cytidylyltransferase